MDRLVAGARAASERPGAPGHSARRERSAGRGHPEGQGPACRQGRANRQGRDGGNRRGRHCPRTFRIGGRRAGRRARRRRRGAPRAGAPHLARPPEEPPSGERYRVAGRSPGSRVVAPAPAFPALHGAGPVAWWGCRSPLTVAGAAPDSIRVGTSPASRLSPTARHGPRAGNLDSADKSRRASPCQV